MQTEAEAMVYDPFGDGGQGSDPWVSEKLPEPVRLKIVLAARLVQQRLSERPACTALFSEIKADGVETLERTFYYPANALMEQRMCWHTYAFTRVGRRSTWICRRMWQLPLDPFALVLVHEALHQAGLKEWPQTKSATDSRAVNARVAAACGF